MDNRLKEIFDRYESGKASIEERKLIENWFASFDNEQQAIENTTNEELLKPVDAHVQHMLYGRKHIYRSVNYWLSAAAAIVFIGIGLFLFKQVRTIQPQAQLTYTVITAPKGLKKEFSLPDGTIVSLNSGSEIRIASTYGINKREVYLTGEAYFSVKHNALRPFTIQSGNLLITDLGTEFNVKAYPEEKQIGVAVESGEVKIEKPGINGKRETLANSMTHNQQLVYNKETNTPILNQIETNNISAWRRNKLCFDNASFDEISHTLERWYNVKIELENNLENYRHYTVSFNNEPIDKVLSVLSHLSGMNYKIINKQSVSINLKNCKKI